MKIVLLGCNHAGTWAAKTLLKKKNPNDEVIIFDRNDNISFLGCGIALWVSGLVRDSKMLFYSSPEELKSLGAKVFTRHEVIDVNQQAKIVTVKDLTTGKVFDQNYDKLIVGAGSWPIVPPIPGIKANNVLIAKLYQHAQTIIEKVKDKKIKNVAVIGAGYIGVELAEAFDLHGKNVYFIEMQNRVTPNTFDEEIAAKLKQGIIENSKINLCLEEKVEQFIANEHNDLTAIKTNKDTYQVDMAIVAIGFKPTVEILKGKVDLTPQGGLIVNEHFQSSDANIYGIGDCVAQYYNPDKCLKSIMLASNAVRSGTLAALNILNNNQTKFDGIQGANAIHVFGWTLAGVGLTEEQTKLPSCAHRNIETITVEDYDKPAFMDDRQKVLFKVVYDKDTKAIIGAQIASKANHAYEIYMLSLAIQKQVKIDELGFIDTYFLPHLNNPVNFITKASLKYLGIVD